MIELRPFRNDDSPAIVALWNAEPLRGRFVPLTTSVLEQHVLAKPYFDPRGLLIAHDSGRPTGFVHVGFTPGCKPGELNRRYGIVCQLMVTPAADPSTAHRLLAAGEQRLRECGATEFLGGGWGVHAPFYLGLYGGCRVPGVLADDHVMNQALLAAGYHEHLSATIWQRSLANFRPPVDRGTMAFRRQFQISFCTEEASGDWSDACAYGWTDRLRFFVAATATGQKIVTLTFWDQEPLASGWGQRSVGLADLAWHNPSDSNEFLTCALAESLRQLQGQGNTLVEIQTDPQSTALTSCCQRLGFAVVDCGNQYRKSANAALHGQQTGDTG